MRFIKGAKAKYGETFSLGAGFGLSETSDGIPELIASGTGIYDLTDLGDVTIGTPSAGPPAHFLKYTGSYWANAVIATTDVPDLSSVYAQASHTHIAGHIQSGTFASGYYSFIGGRVNFAATTTGYASIRLPHGTAPSAPANGDMWTTTTGLYARINSTTRQYANLDGSQTLTNKTMSTSSSWQGNVVTGQYGGTGVANTGRTITLAGNLTTSGAYNVTFTLGATTNVTLPASGTLVASPVGYSQGGTGLTAVATGDLIYGQDASTWARLTAVASGSVLLSGTTPSWGKVTSSHVDSTISTSSHVHSATSLTGAAAMGIIRATTVGSTWEVYSGTTVGKVLKLTTAATNAVWAEGDLALNEIVNPTADKTFQMTTRQLTFLWTAPTGNPMELEASGAYSGSLLHIHQHTGNPGAGTHLVAIEAADTDVELMHLIGPATSTHAVELWVSGDSEDRLRLLAGGTLEWGPGSGATDTNLYRSAANILKTDDAFQAASLLGHLAVMTTTGDMIYSIDGATTNRLPVGTVGQILKSTGSVPQWDDHTVASHSFDSHTGSLTVTNIGGASTGAAIIRSSDAVTPQWEVYSAASPGQFLRLVTGSNDDVWQGADIDATMVAGGIFQNSTYTFQSRIDLRDGSWTRGSLLATGYHEGVWLGVNLYYDETNDPSSYTNWRYLQDSGTYNLCGFSMFFKGNGGPTGSYLKLWSVPQSTGIGSTPASSTQLLSVTGDGTWVLGGLGVTIPASFYIQSAASGYNKLILDTSGDVQMLSRGSMTFDIDSDNNQSSRLFQVSYHNMNSVLFRIYEDSPTAMGPHGVIINPSTWTTPALPTNMTEGLVVRRDSGTIPSLNSASVAVFSSSSATGTNGFVHIITGNTGIGALYFGDTDLYSQGAVSYNHDTDVMTLRNAGVDRVTVNGTGMAITGALTITTALNEVYGGTGFSSYTAYAMLYASATDAIDQVTPNTTTTQKFLSMTGDGAAGGVPSWEVVAASAPAGGWDVADGGTGIQSWTAYSLVLTGTTATGDFQELSPGASDTVLVSQGPGALPQWAAMSPSYMDSGTFGGGNYGFTNDIIVVGNILTRGDYVSSDGTYLYLRYGTSNTGMAIGATTYVYSSVFQPYSAYSDLGARSYPWDLISSSVELYRGQQYYYYDGTEEYRNGTKTSTFTPNWNNGNVQSMNVGAALTIDLDGTNNNMHYGTPYTLIVHSTGSYALGWDFSSGYLKWNDAEPSDPTNGQTCVVTFLKIRNQADSADILIGTVTMATATMPA